MGQHTGVPIANGKSRVRIVTFEGEVSTIAGGSTAPLSAKEKVKEGVLLSDAAFNNPQGIAVDQNSGWL